MNINLDFKGKDLTSRVGLIVYLKNVSDQYKLRRYGDIVYFSKKMRYCIIYLDADDAIDLKRRISSLSFVEKVDYSVKDTLNLDSNHIETEITKMSKNAEIELLKRQEKNEEKFN